MTTPTRPATLPQEVWQRPFVKAHQRWCDDFVVELRLRDVPGPVIGDRLAEVEGHCAETGETPSESFGDATGYAARINEDSAPDRAPGVRKVTALSSAQVLAMLVGTAAVPAWVRGEPLAADVVQVVCLVAFLLLLLSLPLLLSPLVRHPWTAGLPVVAAVVGTGVAAALSGRMGLPTVVQLPAPAVAVGLFVAVLVLAWAEYRALARDGDDLVTSPLAPAPGRQSTNRRRGPWAGVLPACLVPTTYLALATLGWLVA